MNPENLKTIEVCINCKETDCCCHYTNYHSCQQCKFCKEIFIKPEDAKTHNCVYISGKVIIKNGISGKPYITIKEIGQKPKYFELIDYR